MARICRRRKAPAVAWTAPSFYVWIRTWQDVWIPVDLGPMHLRLPLELIPHRRPGLARIFSAGWILLSVAPLYSTPAGLGMPESGTWDLPLEMSRVYGTLWSSFAVWGFNFAGSLLGSLAFDLTTCNPTICEAWKEGKNLEVNHGKDFGVGRILWNANARKSVEFSCCSTVTQLHMWNIGRGELEQKDCWMDCHATWSNRKPSPILPQTGAINDCKIGGLFFYKSRLQPCCRKELRPINIGHCKKCTE